MVSDRINTRLPEELANHVHSMVGSRFETPSEYIRDLIRRDMDNSATYHIEQSIKSGYSDIKSGKYYKSTGNWEEDKKLFRKRESEEWN